MTHLTPREQWLLSRLTSALERIQELEETIERMTQR